MILFGGKNPRVEYNTNGSLPYIAVVAYSGRGLKLLFIAWNPSLTRAAKVIKPLLRHEDYPQRRGHKAQAGGAHGKRKEHPGLHRLSLHHPYVGLFPGMRLLTRVWLLRICRLACLSEGYRIVILFVCTFKRCFRAWLATPRNLSLPLSFYPRFSGLKNLTLHPGFKSSDREISISGDDSKQNGGLLFRRFRSTFTKQALLH